MNSIPLSSFFTHEFLNSLPPDEREDFQALLQVHSTETTFPGELEAAKAYFQQWLDNTPPSNQRELLRKAHDWLVRQSSSGQRATLKQSTFVRLHSNGTTAGLEDKLDEKNRQFLRLLLQEENTSPLREFVRFVASRFPAEEPFSFGVLVVVGRFRALAESVHSLLNGTGDASSEKIIGVIQDFEGLISGYPFNEEIKRALNSPRTVLVTLYQKVWGNIPRKGAWVASDLSRGKGHDPFNAGRASFREVELPIPILGIRSEIDSLLTFFNGDLVSLPPFDKRHACEILKEALGKGGLYRSAILFIIRLLDETLLPKIVGPAEQTRIAHFRDAFLRVLPSREERDNFVFRGLERVLGFKLTTDILNRRPHANTKEIVFRKQVNGHVITISMRVTFEEGMIRLIEFKRGGAHGELVSGAFIEHKLLSRLAPCYPTLIGISLLAEDGSALARWKRKEDQSFERKGLNEKEERLPALRDERSRKIQEGVERSNKTDEVDLESLVVRLYEMGLKDQADKWAATIAEKSTDDLKSIADALSEAVDQQDGAECERILERMGEGKPLQESQINRGLKGSLKARNGRGGGPKTAVKIVR